MKTDETIALAAASFGRPRLENQLGRAVMLSQAVDRWSARTSWVVSRADEAYPKRLKVRLKEDAPSLFYA